MRGLHSVDGNLGEVGGGEGGRLAMELMQRVEGDEAWLGTHIEV